MRIGDIFSSIRIATTSRIVEKYLLSSGYIRHMFVEFKANHVSIGRHKYRLRWHIQLD